MDLFDNQEIIQFPVDNWLINRDSRGSLRVVHLNCHWDENEHAYGIYRITGIYSMKQTEQPTIWVKTGKVKRTVTEQARLQYNHLIKEYKDKGYKELTKPVNEYSKKELDEIAGQYKTSVEGLLKPMLAKQYQDIANKKVFNKVYLGSRKINGVRCSLYFKDGKIHSHSRGGIDYDFVLDHIINHPLLIKLFQANPNLIMDGEIYKHGWTLNKISGICRSQKTAYDGEPLEFYFYDIVDPELTFIDRFAKMLKIKKLLKLTFEPERDWEEGELKMQFVPQEKVSGLENMMKLHDKYVSKDGKDL